jgi:hypothetical protein
MNPITEKSMSKLVSFLSDDMVNGYRIMDKIRECMAGLTLSTQTIPSSVIFVMLSGLPNR